MKKLLIFLFVFVLFFNVNYSYANDEAMQENQNVSNEQVQNQYVVVDELVNGYLLVKQNESYGIFNSYANSFYIQPTAHSVKFLNDDKAQFIFYSDTVLYVDLYNGHFFEFAPNEEVYTHDSLFSYDGVAYYVKRDGNYYLYNRNSNLITGRGFQKIYYNNEGQILFFLSKDENGVVYYNIDGNEESPYVVDGNKQIDPFVQDLKPEILNAIIENKRQSNFVEGQVTLNEEPEYVEPVLDVDTFDETAVVRIGFKKYHILTKDGKFAIKNNKGKVIVPPKYDSYVIKKPCVCYLTPLFFVTSNGHTYVYDTNGKLLAEPNFANNTYNLYKNGSVYEYNGNFDTPKLSKDGNTIGLFEYDANFNVYRYNNVGYDFLKPHKLLKLIEEIKLY